MKVATYIIMADLFALATCSLLLRESDAPRGVIAGLAAADRMIRVESVFPAGIGPADLVVVVEAPARGETVAVRPGERAKDGQLSVAATLADEKGAFTIYTTVPVAIRVSVLLASANASTLGALAAAGPPLRVTVSERLGRTEVWTDTVYLDAGNGWLVSKEVNP